MVPFPSFNVNFFHISFLHFLQVTFLFSTCHPVSQLQAFVGIIPCTWKFHSPNPSLCPPLHTSLHDIYSLFKILTLPASGTFSPGFLSISQQSLWEFGALNIFLFYIYHSRIFFNLLDNMCRNVLSQSYPKLLQSKQIKHNPHSFAKIIYLFNYWFHPHVSWVPWKQGVCLIYHQTCTA